MVSSRSGLLQSMCWQLPQEPRAEHVLAATAGASCRAWANSNRRSLEQSMCWQQPQEPWAEHVLAATARASCRACAGSYRRSLTQSACRQLVESHAACVLATIAGVLCSIDAAATIEAPCNPRAGSYKAGAHAERAIAATVGAPSERVTADSVGACRACFPERAPAATVGVSGIARAGKRGNPVAGSGRRNSSQTPPLWSQISRTREN